MSNKINQLKAGTLLSYVQMALNCIVGLVYTPFYDSTIGSE